MPVEVCKIGGCERSAKHNGLCGPHFFRAWRHGSPTEGGTFRGEPLRFLIEVAVPYEGDDCLAWPFAKTGRGYGHINLKGKKVKAHRYVCTIVKGAPPSAKHVAAHECGNGHLGCVNPKHLTWKTASENVADRAVHGTSCRGERHFSAKLTEEQVRQIISLKGVETAGRTGKRFGVDASTVSKIHRGEIWGWLATTHQAEAQACRS